MTMTMTRRRRRRTRRRRKTLIKIKMITLINMKMKMAIYLIDFQRYKHQIDNLLSFMTSTAPHLLLHRNVAGSWISCQFRNYLSAAAPAPVHLLRTNLSTDMAMAVVKTSMALGSTLPSERPGDICTASGQFLPLTFTSSNLLVRLD